MHLETAPSGALTVTACSYSLSVDAMKPRALLRGADGAVWSDLSLLCSADALGIGPDESWGVEAPEVAQSHPDRARIVLRSRSSVWTGKQVVLELGEEDLAVHLEVEADAPTPLGDVTLLGGRGVLRSGATGQFRSSIVAASVVCPNPAQPVSAVRSAHTPAVISANGDAEPGRLHAVFSPAPFVLTLHREAAPAATSLPDGEQLALALRCGIEQATFTRFHYEPLDGGFLLRLDHEGHTTVQGSWRSPSVVLRPALSFDQALADHREDLAAHGLLPAAVADPAPWHLRPIFCGWGAQCARAADIHRGRADAPGDGGFVGGATAASAPALSRADLYDQWLGVMDEAGLDPGTIVIDDRWQAAYGTNTVDTDKWPDLRGWIRDRHREGRRVLLWWKAWDAEGLPAAECLRTPDGSPVALDPASPAYRERLHSMLERLLGPESLDADGFKTDFTQRMPTGALLRRADDAPEGAPWGVALLHRLISDLRHAAKQVKPDALVVTQTPNPLFADVTDMLRLNDIFETGVHGETVTAAEQLRWRAAVASAALPGTPLDTDQWPIQDRAQWRDYVRRQADLGVPALYYLESIDNSGEALGAEDLALVRSSWERYAQLTEHTPR